MRAIIPTLSAFLRVIAIPQKVFAWGDDGHMAVALIAQHYLTPAVKTQIGSERASNGGWELATAIAASLALLPVWATHEHCHELILRR
jgi:hypothetical protein